MDKMLVDTRNGERMSYLTGQPILILKEGSSRRRGRDAQRSNMSAAQIVANVVKSTLGPRGMDKMLVDTLGDMNITNDGATILDEIDVQNPAGKMMVEVAKTQDDEVGDGTTSAVIFAGELLKNAEHLLDDEIHSTTIVSGYKRAEQKAIEVLNQIAMPVDLKDRELLKKIALTSMRSKGVGGALQHFADISIDAVMQVMEKRGNDNFADIDNIQITTKEGKSLQETELIRGVIVDKEVSHPGMPKTITNPKIALLNCALEIEKPEFSTEVRIHDPSQLKAFMDEETNMMRNMVTRIKSSGANVALCQKGIDDAAQHFLAKEGIMAVRRIKQSDMEKLAKATGAKIVTNLESLSASDLGAAGLAEERRLGDDKMVFIQDCKDPKAVAILVRAGLERLVHEAERTLKDSLSVVADVIRKNKIVAGGGSVEIEVAKHIKEYAAQIGGREQLAVEAFATSLESIPRILAENAGIDPIDILVGLRSAHEKREGIWMGVNVFNGKVDDMNKLGVLEPVSVKEQAIKSAVEVASMILRIDDVIQGAKPPPAPPQPPGGGMGGMPGY